MILAVAPRATASLSRPPSAVLGGSAMNCRRLLLAALLLLAAVPAYAQVPRSVFIEEGGATW
jgi:hypothetical protein